jgi:hypothetical protein
MEDACVLAEVLREADSVESVLHTYASRLGPAGKSRRGRERSSAVCHPQCHFARVGSSDNAVPFRTARIGGVAVRYDPTAYVKSDARLVLLMLTLVRPEAFHLHPKLALFEP